MNKYLAIGLATILAGCGQMTNQTTTIVEKQKTVEEPANNYVGKPIAVTYAPTSHCSSRKIYLVLQNGTHKRMFELDYNTQINGITPAPEGIAALLMSEMNDGDDELVQVKETKGCWNTIMYQVTTEIKPETEKSVEAQAPALNPEHN